MQGGACVRLRAQRLRVFWVLFVEVVEVGVLQRQVLQVMAHSSCLYDLRLLVLFSPPRFRYCAASRLRYTLWITPAFRTGEGCSSDYFLLSVPFVFFRVIFPPRRASSSFPEPDTVRWTRRHI